MNIGDGDFIIANHFHISLKLTQILHHVIGERIIIIDHQNHDWLSPTTISTARKIARALFMVSFHSSAGTESATMPPPACTYNLPFLMTAVRIAMAVSILPFQSM